MLKFNLLLELVLCLRISLEKKQKHLSKNPRQCLLLQQIQRQVLLNKTVQKRLPYKICSVWAQNENSLHPSPHNSNQNSPHPNLHLNNSQNSPHLNPHPTQTSQTLTTKKWVKQPIKPWIIYTQINNLNRNQNKQQQMVQVQQHRINQE